MSAGPSFRFRLERIRALRERRADVARQELARATERLNGSENRLRAVDEALTRVLDDQRRALANEQLSAGELVARQAFAEHVEAQRSLGRRDVERDQADVEDRSSELGDAAREHQMLERLKERQRDEHDRESARREAAALDEVALERFRRSVA